MGMNTSKDPSEPIAVWTGQELLRPGEPADTLTIILKTVGCTWGKCLMCGFYNMTSDHPVSTEQLLAQYEKAMSRCPPGAIIKLYTSGSFYDPKEVPLDAQREILRRLGADPRVRRVIIETMPEYITPGIFPPHMPPVKELWLAVGLETSNDMVRRQYVVKGFTFEDFRQACRVAGDRGASVKAYLLLKPPYLTERRAMEDALQSVRDAFSIPNVRTASLNLTNIQRGTPVERLWRRGEYRPPWLWSAARVLQRAREESPADRIVFSDPLAAGSARGPHNCGKCDPDFARGLRQFILTQDPRDLRVECACESAWEKHLELEEYTFGAPL